MGLDQVLRDRQAQPHSTRIAGPVEPIENARQVLEVQRQYGSFDSYVWSFVDHKPLINEFQSLAEIPAQTAQSTALSKALRQRGFGFVGPTIIYAFMQSAGLVNDHILSCPARSRILALSPSENR